MTACEAVPGPTQPGLRSTSLQLPATQPGLAILQSTLACTVNTRMQTLPHRHQCRHHHFASACGHHQYHHHRSAAACGHHRYHHHHLEQHKFSVSFLFASSTSLTPKGNQWQTNMHTIAIGDIQTFKLPTPHCSEPARPKQKHAEECRPCPGTIILTRLTACVHQHECRSM